MKLSSIDEIVECARNGKTFVLVDDENRENEGDLIFPAQLVTPDVINFMAKYGRGLICLALTEERSKALDLKRMDRRNTSQFDTAFTVSIEAKEGVTVIKVKYSDTDAMFDKQVKNALREFGIPEDVIQQQNFKYG